MTTLADLPRRHLFTLAGGDGQLIWLNHVEGGSSFCRDSDGNVRHILAAALVTPVPSPGHVVLRGGAAIWCLTCGMISYNARDIIERYCGRCRMFH